MFFRAVAQSASMEPAVKVKLPSLDNLFPNDK